MSVRVVSGPSPGALFRLIVRSVEHTTMFRTEDEQALVPGLRAHVRPGELVLSASGFTETERILLLQFLADDLGDDWSVDVRSE